MNRPLVAAESQHPTAILVAPPAAASATVSRRRVLRLAFWTSLGALAASGAAALLNSLYPRGLAGFGGPVPVPASLVPAPGAAPRMVLEGQCWLVNLAAGEGQMGERADGTPGGLLALWRRCPHLGCTVPWAGDYSYAEDPQKRRGWFRCPCHGSTYTKAGVVVRGPASRGMDTMLVEVDGKGNVTVQTAMITKGGADNPLRATPYTPRSG